MCIQLYRGSLKPESSGYGNPEGSRPVTNLYGIGPVETMKQGRQKGNQFPLSQKTLSIILGSLLGDGSLKINKHYKNARFSFRHGWKQRDYFFWKVEQLKEISGKKYWWIQKADGKSREKKLRYQSKALPALTELYRLTHKGNTKKIKRKWLNLMDELSLAVWWMDDGSIIANGRKGVFCSENFTKKEQKILSRYLRKVWGIETKVGRVQKEGEKYRLWFRSTNELKRFLRLILKYVQVESMLPKVVLLYKNPLLQQRWISEVAKHTGFSEEKIRKVVEGKKKRWKQYSASENDIVRSSPKGELK